jgi:TonB family protein
MNDDNIRLVFEIFEGGEVVETRELDRDVVKIGKLASSHLRLERAGVSRIHAVVERSGDGNYSVIDLGSAEGTYVNGEQVTKETVEGGDELRFGDVTVRLRFQQIENGAAKDTTSASGDQQQSSVNQPQKAGAQRGRADGDQRGGAEEMADTAQDGGQSQASNTITTEQGREVEPYTLQGYYDEGGNYIPGYYDEHGQYHLGYGYYDDQGQWQVAYGYYDPEGNWVPTEEPVQSVGEATRGGGERPIWERRSDRKEYTHSFFSEDDGDTLEVAHLWGDHVLSVSSFKEARSVTIGPGKADDFRVGERTAESETPLVIFNDGRWMLTLTERMTGYLRQGREEKTLQQLIESGQARQSAQLQDGYLIPIGPQTSARLELDDHTFLVHFTKMPAVSGVGFSVDKAPLPYQAVSAAAHILFLLAAMSLPGDAGDLSLDEYSDQNRFAEMVLKPEQKKKKKPDWMKKGNEEKAAKHKGEETKAGKKDSEQTDKKMQVKGDPNNDNSQLKKKRNKKVAMNAGVMKMFQQDQVASEFGDASKSVGSDAIHALGNLDGKSGGESKGFGGLGLEGSGRGGGGGMSEDGLGIGEVGTAGRGGGGRGGDGYGEGQGDLGEKEQAQPEVVPQRPDVDGSLDKEIIRKVVRQHRREVKYCYEKELQKNEGLKGRVVVQFTISPSGGVVAALITESTLGNTNVERCMQNKIRRWTFPAPKGGGVVKVNYPFNFSSS